MSAGARAAAGRLYRRWMAFAERLNRVMVGLLFGVIYFAVVPLFLFVRFRDRLGARDPGAQSSFWAARAEPAQSHEQLSRMG